MGEGIVVLCGEGTQKKERMKWHEKPPEGLGDQIRASSLLGHTQGKVSLVTWATSLKLSSFDPSRGYSSLFFLPLLPPRLPLCSLHSGRLKKVKVLVVNFYMGE